MNHIIGPLIPPVFLPHMIHANSTPPAHSSPSWRVTRSENPQVYGGQDHFVVQIDPEHGSGLIVADIEPQMSEAEANARLIAAAPELLTAAREARDYVRFLTADDSYGKDDPAAMIRLLDQVIAKAEGRE